MWTVGNQKKVEFADFTKIAKDLSGDLNDVEAKISLAKFLKENIGFTLELFTGFKLLPVQELIIKSILIRDNSLIVAARGFSKSTIISILSILLPIFWPNSKGTLISANFRRARSILEESEKILKNKKAELMRQCFPEKLSKANDMYRQRLPNGSEVFALPLSTGSGLRGTRSSWIALDEGLLISRDIQSNILRPFLTVKQDVQYEMEIKETEDQLIKDGIITEKDRISFPKNKYIIFSSASYKFEYLYEIYTEYIENILNPSKDEKDNPSYFVMRASYEAMPENNIFDMTQINSAKANGGESTEYFKREYRALFSDGNDGFFNIKRLHESIIKIGDYPTIQIKGDKDYQYILAIDPSYSAAKNSDYFAMAVYMLVPQERKIILVHTYGKAGGNLKDHFEYLTYILNFFNIVFIVIDDSGTEFISGYNESTTAKDRNLNLSFLDFDANSDEYQLELSKVKRQYNLTSRKIVYGQPVNSQAARQANEHLQNQIEAKKIWFGSALGANSEEFNKAITVSLPYKFKDNDGKELNNIDFIDDQDAWVKETIAQTALIEVKSTTLGTLQYDLPKSLKGSTSNTKARKDHYTCMLFACWGAKLFFDIMFTEAKPTTNTFTPIVIPFSNSN